MDKLYSVSTVQMQTFLLNDLDKFQATYLKIQYFRYMTNNSIRLNPEPGDSDDQAAGGAPQVISSSFVNVLYKQYFCYCFLHKYHKYFSTSLQMRLCFIHRKQQFLSFLLQMPQILPSSIFIHMQRLMISILVFVGLILGYPSNKGGIANSEKKTLPRYNTWTPRQVTLPWQATH